MCGYRRGTQTSSSTVGLEVELKLNLPSSCEETNQEARLAIDGAGGGYRCKGQARVRGLWREEKLSICFCLVFHHAARNVKPPRLPKEVQIVSARLPWESLW